MNYYIIGILGSGTSALASLLIQMKNNVKGTDVCQAIKNYDGPLEVDDIRFVHPQTNYIYIYGNAFKNHPLTKIVSNLGYNVMSYSQMLEHLSFDKRIQISASHGKTFTTALLSHMLNSSRLIGDGTAKYLGDEEFVYEGCEYQNTFLTYHPDFLVILNIDYDHVDFFKTKQDYFNAFVNASRNAKFLIIDSNIKIQHNNKYTFSLDDSCADLFGNLVYSNDLYSIIDIKFKGKSYRIKSPFITKYENNNLLACILTSLLLGRDIDSIENKLLSFKRPKRRMDIRNINGYTLILDYAHHPTQIIALYEYINSKFKGKRKLIVYEGHTLSRSLFFLKEYKEALSRFDEVMLYPIFYARENKSKREKEYYTYLKYPKYNVKKILKKYDKNEFVFIFAGAGIIDLEYENVCCYVKNEAL